VSTLLHLKSIIVQTTMYFSNLVVDGVAKRLPELFNCLKQDEPQFKKITKTDDDLTYDRLPNEPVYWPEQSPNARVSSYRSTGAFAVVHGGGDGLLIKLNVGVGYESFMERKYMGQTVIPHVQSGTVLAEVQGRSFLPNVLDNLTAPRLGGGTDADLAMHVEKGHHVEGVAARLVALALEHSLVPFTQRTRIRNAASCYWCLPRYRNDAIRYSLQNTHAALAWASVGAVGEENDPKVVIWVADAAKTRGMSLLSRIMDAGGPMRMQTAFLNAQFDPGHLLMVGTGSLMRDFRAIQPEDLLDAIDEALWLLVTYNNLEPNFITNALRLLIRNLPIADLSHYREQGAVHWRVRVGQHGDPDLGEGIDVLVDDAIADAFDPDALASIGLDDPALARGVLSDLFRRQVLAPPADLDNFAPPSQHIVRWEVAGLLGAMQRDVHTGAIDGVNAYFSEFDPAVPPNVPNVPALTRGAFDDIMSCFSGRAAFRILAYSQGPDAGGNIVVPDGWVDLGAPAAAGMPAPDGLAADGHWLTWVRGNDLAGMARTMTGVLRQYVVQQWQPCTREQYQHDYEEPPAALRRYDAPADMRFAVRMNGAWPELNDQCPRIWAFVNENDAGGTPLSFLSEDGQRPLNVLNNGQKTAAFIRGMCYVWDANRGAGVMNDAFSRWNAVNHAARQLTTIPDELMLYLGGLRSRKYVEAAGGLWTLCYQVERERTNIAAGHESTTTIFRNRDALASSILMLRCAVEMADQMLRVSNARIRGCAEPFLWPNEVDARIARARIYDTTDIDGATYLARQALVLAAVFDHPDSVVARTFGVDACSTLRLREPRVNAALNLEQVQHMNWLSPQVLHHRTWTHYYGIAAPSFLPDRHGRAWLGDARYSTEWLGVDDSFQAGVMMHRSDEVWSAILTSFVSDEWHPALVDLTMFGQALRIDVSRVRSKYYRGYTQVMARLNLPYECQLSAAVVHDTGLDDMERPDLISPTSNYVDGAAIQCCDVVYDAKGRLTSIVLNGDPADYELLDIHDTAFCSGGVEFRATSMTQVMPGYLVTERSVGQFWMSVTNPVGMVSAGLSAGAQRLLTLLAPPPPVNSEDDGGGAGVRGPDRVHVDAPDISKGAHPGTFGTGNLPTHELNMTSADTVMSSLSGLSDEALQLIRNALLKDKGGDFHSNDTATTKSNTTRGTPSDGGMEERSDEVGAGASPTSDGN
jgi:hypothetical protein